MSKTKKIDGDITDDLIEFQGRVRDSNKGSEIKT